jgi:transposase-like protein
MRDLGLVGELFRDDLVQENEWWIPNLARELGVIPQKIHYWIKQSWIHSCRTPSGKHLVIWADKEEIRRLKQMAKVKNSWIRARHSDLIIPKRRPAR